ncbi:F-box associated interaction domain-containing protein [Artemisia annua]|uniref:F-box associated interaction domain-containing protein n=1 Tax=Artemisia annua TaxID=35608 RepID=A0A2U1PBQ0_ARTAN|nr:F-box associated interaction domain-containing protein [Artemisia annua]
MARKNKQKSKASFLPEIIREILLKATVKSLLRCKSVCKEWYSLISDQHFIKSHYTLSSTDNINYEHHRLVFINGIRTKCLTTCPLHDVLFNKSVSNALVLENPLQQPRSRDFMIVGSCNGLMCLFVVDNFTLFIYNPSTRTTNILPGSNQGLRISYGFGYDEITHDHKYSLKAGTWKEIGHIPRAIPYNDAKFFNGTLHWAIDDARSDSWDIVSLDLRMETYGEVLQPEYDEGSYRLTLGVFGEWLCVCCNYYESRVVVVWVMKAYGVKDSWTKLLSISHPSDRFWVPLYTQFHAPLCISNDGKLLLQLRTKLVVYDCVNGSYSEIQDLHVFPDVCIVIESLVSPFAPLGLGDNNGDEN